MPLPAAFYDSPSTPMIFLISNFAAEMCQWYVAGGRGVIISALECPFKNITLQPPARENYLAKLFSFSVLFQVRLFFLLNFPAVIFM